MLRHEVQQLGQKHPKQDRTMLTECFLLLLYFTAVQGQQLLKGGAPAWDEGHPFNTGPNADAVSKAHERFIRHASALFRDWPRSAGLRAVATNFQDPTRLPRVINI